MTNQDNDALSVADEAARLLSEVMNEHQCALDKARTATANLVQRQCTTITLPTDPEFRINLIHDIMAVDAAFQDLAVRAETLIEVTIKLAPIVLNKPET